MDDSLEETVLFINPKKLTSEISDYLKAEGVTIAEYDKVFDEFDKEVGFNYLRGMHLNDSKKALGTHVDRHDSIGEGLIGKAFFERLMQDSRFDNMPLILETPDESKWKEEIAWLKSME